MRCPAPFTVLIDRRLPRAVLVALACAALLLPGFSLTAAHGAQGRPHRAKMSRELDEALSGTGSASWVRDVGGVRHVQALLVTDGADPQMTDLRRAVHSLGGSVHAVHAAAHSMTVQIKASLLDTLAQRADVLNVVPNRPTHRTFSTMESITGAGTPNVRTGDAKTQYAGLGGTGIGVAVLDSGVMKAHLAFLNGSGANRVLRNVSMINTSAANWTAGGAPNVTTLQPGSAQQLAYESLVANDSAANQDGYGHGTHVASVLAGRAKFYTYANDTSGVAPNANIVDVKVLNDAGMGTLSDAVEGMEWILYHAKEYNIRVINISLATDSSDSWELDPLCIAARSATAAGITVVAAAGNFGKNLSGKEVYGAIGAPGNDPSVITVGAANFKGTATRSDDSVDFFSSRGPTRGTRVMPDGSQRIDNLLKPDLVAPGNKIVAAGAATGTGTSLTWNLLGALFKSQLVTPVGITQSVGQSQMMLSGTSIAAPAVSGAVALMLEANPGLTPPLVKAILQYCHDDD